MSKIRKPSGLLTIVGLVAIGMLIAAQAASANIIRPNGATPVSDSLVIAYDACTVATPPGNHHNPANLPGAACTPPTASTNRLTAGGVQVNGTTDNFKGNVLLKVTGPPNDVNFGTGPPSGSYLQDVRCTASYESGIGAGVCNDPGSTNAFAPPGTVSLNDYTGQLNALAYIKITDQKNNSTGTSYTEDGTVALIPFGVVVRCSVTGNTIGASCVPILGSAGAVCGCVSNGKRGNIELSQIVVYDGGDDGLAPPPLQVDADGKAYAVQGVFLP